MQSVYDLFLFFGYLPNFSEGNFDWLEYDPDQKVDFDENDESLWVNEGTKLFKEMINRQIADTPANAVHILPLSGGCDSRAILGGLLDNLPKSQIVTVTYGIPGSWDFEIAQLIARKFGLYQECINLLDERWDLDRMVAAGARLDRPVSVYEAYVHQKMHDCYGKNCILWSGFMAGNLGGGILTQPTSSSKEQAIEMYLEYNSVQKFIYPSYREEIFKRINDEFHWRDINKTHICYELQLDFSIRQKYYIHPTVMVKGFDVRTPFLNKKWVNFILQTPWKWLYREYLFKRIISECYKELFKLPVRNNAGLPLWCSKNRFILNKAIAKVKPKIIRKDPYGSHPRTNYINFTESLRHKSEFQNVVYITIQDLIKRGILDDVDMNRWWKEHLTRKADHTRLLLNLSSLEILLKSGSI